MLTLTRFRVSNFRSVRDSGWIDTSAVTALIGTNESGKTNLLVPLWKLNPAKDGEIDLMADLPRSEYNSLRQSEQYPVFIEAEFDTSANLRDSLSEVTALGTASFDVVRVARRFDGSRQVEFPSASPTRSTQRSKLADIFERTAAQLANSTLLESEDAVRTAMQSCLAQVREHVSQLEPAIELSSLVSLRRNLDAVNVNDQAGDSSVLRAWNALLAEFGEIEKVVGLPRPEDMDDAVLLVLDDLPSFVYYSNYGNLDSEIYLPHVIDNMKRETLGAKEAAKARTLKVLFEYVQLSPAEILKLGERAAPANGTANPTTQAIEDAAKRTKERDILLRSADTALTKSFREWWKQGDYRFRFAADGDHFRIWVSDDRRPEEIELESRSTGLQWFFSFFLVFLVERKDAHRGAILLLDEPGLSLHPLSQKDLSKFFESLSGTNPIVYTTHSPFMVDADNLDRVRLVYVDSSGATAVSSDLRAASSRTSEGRSVYAVHAALGLSVSDALLQGCQSVVVEGPSDQIYMSAMKIAVVGRAKFAPKREILFVPAGGAKGVQAIAPIVAAKDGAPPFVLLDDDRQGRQFGESLRATPLYKASADRVVSIRDFVQMEGAEIEDLIPPPIVVDVASRMVRGHDDDFRDIHKEGAPIVPQIEAFASANGSKLELGWKVELARQVKTRLLRDLDKLDDSTLDRWASMFGLLTAEA